MKTKNQPHHRLAAGLLLAVSLLVTSSGFAAGAPPATPTVDAKTIKPYALFVGTDFTIKHQGVAYPIENVKGGSFVIRVKGQEVQLPMSLRTNVGMNMKSSLKLSRSVVAVGDYKGERAYTPANDPSTRLSREMAKQQLFASEMIAATTQAQNELTEGTLKLNPDVTVPGRSTDPGGDAENLARLTANYDKTVVGAGSSLNLRQDLRDSGNAELFDALGLNFTVEAERPVAEPYVIVVTEFRLKDDKPGVISNSIYAQALEPIGTEPKKVKILQGGFPPGYELKKFTVHLYDHGREIGTNVSEKYVGLSRDEAQEYIVMDYVATNKGATLKPSVSMGLRRADLASRYAGAAAEQEIYVKVSRDGLPEGVYRDAGAAQPLDDAYLAEAVQSVRFKPALQAGKPVATVARLRINELSL